MRQARPPLPPPPLRPLRRQTCHRSSSRCLRCDGSRFVRSRQLWLANALVGARATVMVHHEVNVTLIENRVGFSALSRARKTPGPTVSGIGPPLGPPTGGASAAPPPRPPLGAAAPIPPPPTHTHGSRRGGLWGPPWGAVGVLTALIAPDEPRGLRKTPRACLRAMMRAKIVDCTRLKSLFN